MYGTTCYHLGAYVDVVLPAGPSLSEPYAGRPSGFKVFSEAWLVVHPLAEFHNLFLTGFSHQTFVGGHVVLADLEL